MDSEKQVVLDFIQQQPLMVVSTVNTTGLPEAAVVGFCVTENFEVIFDTSNLSRKYKNLATNTNVAAVLGWDNGITVQYEGAAHEVVDAGEIETCWKLMIAKEPAAEKYKGEPDSRMFKITPHWVRYSDLKVNPWKIIELKF